mmetsp:Transcript_2050/g.2228  ORF Transcript_2050/g.2228 Transcript_2050/m.2228 type:complete len:200 (-) Transcript_2050:304-903(-)
MISLGAGRPGIAAVVIIIWHSFACSRNISISFRMKSSLITLAYPVPSSPSSSAKSRRRNSPPRDSTCSLQSRRVSKARTIAPILEAVLIAARPATPAPITKTFVAAKLPAAVTSPFKNLWYIFAPSITARYPAIFACELKTSRLWARETRGIASTARRLTPAATALFISAFPLSVRGPTKLIIVLPLLNMSISCILVTG